MDTGELRPDLRGAQGRHVLVALSGGADSVALLLALREAGVRVSAAHFEHGLRGEASAQDMDFCRALCERLAVPFYCERARVMEKRRPGEGVEQAARRLRYDFLRRAREAAGADVIATAHHADDQAETVLMHILRGTGPQGASGIGEDSPAGRCIRPLLGARKREIVAYLRVRGQDWREDASNAVADTPRNALRLEVMPRLEAVYPGATRALCRFAQAQAVENRYMDAQTAMWAQRAVRLPNGSFYPMDDAPDEAILRRFWRGALGPDQAAFERIAQLAALCAQRRGRRALPDGRTAEKTERGLYIVDERGQKQTEVSLQLDGDTDVPGRARFTASACAAVAVRDQPFAQALSRAAMEGAVVRARREGDFIRPLGMRGTKLLSDYLTDRKVDRPLRDHVLLIARESEVLWAVGVGVSQTCALRPGAEAVLLRCRPEAEFYEYFFGGTKR